VDENIYEISRRKAEMISDILDHQNGKEEGGEDDENSDKNQSLISNILTDALNKLIQQQKGEDKREQQHSEEEGIVKTTLKRSKDRETPNSPSLIFQSISPNEEEEEEEIL